MRRVIAGAALVAALISLSGCTALGHFVIDGVAGGTSFDDEAYVPLPQELDVPDRFTIRPDPWQAEYVGALADGRQYFLGADIDLLADKVYVSVYFWNADGTFDEAEITEYGETKTVDLDALNEKLDARHNALDGATIEPITVAPFSVEQDGSTFGFVARGPDHEYYDIASVTHMPNDDMAYYWPWDGEGYDT